MIIAIGGSSRAGILGLGRHLSLMLFTSRAVGRRCCSASPVERRVLPRSSPNIGPHGGGHRRMNGEEEDEEGEEEEEEE